MSLRDTSRPFLRCIGIAVAVLALQLAATAAFAQSAPSGSARRGRQIFTEEHCAQCHGTLGQGLPEAGPRIVPPPRTLGDFVEFVRMPQGDMAPVSAARVSDADLADIYAFLRANASAKWAKQ